MCPDGSQAFRKNSKDRAGKTGFQELNPIIDKYKDKTGVLIPVLHEVQNKLGYLSPEVQEYVADRLNIPVSKVHGVVSFYSFFSTTPNGDHTIGVCMGTACYAKGAEDILNEIKDELDVDHGETSDDGKFTLTTKRCLGCCSEAPVVMIDDTVHGNLSREDVSDVLNQY